MLTGQDIVVLLKLAAAGPDWTVRSLEGDLEIPRSVVHRSLQRLGHAQLFDVNRRRVNIGQSEEFLVHAVKYLFPPELRGESRGIPTAWAARPLVDELAPQTDLPPVWPDPEGDRRGLAVIPLHPAVPQLAMRDPALGEQLALVDAIRMGDARVRQLAGKLLTERLERAPQAA